MEVKLLIVEDETILREGICKVGNWAENGIEICGAAANGYEALKLIDENKPDVVLTDVVMPVMDGIELAREISKRYPEIRLVMLSGHEEFQYAQKAIEYKVREYLLKPAKIELIMEVMLRLKAEILKEREERKEEILLREKLTQSIPILREQYFNKLVRGYMVSNEEIYRQLDFLDINLSLENLAVLVCEKDSSIGYGNESELINIKIKELCKEVLESEYNCFVFTDLKDRVVTVLNYNQQMKPADVILYISGKASRIQKEMKLRWGYTLSVGIGRPVRNIRQLPKAYNEAEYALSYRFFMGDDSIIYIGDLEYEDTDSQIYFEQIEQALITCIKTGDTIGAKEKTDELFLLLKQSFIGKPQSIFDELIMLVSMISRSLNKIENSNEEFKGLHTLLSELKNSDYTTLSELQEKVTDTIVDTSNIINTDRIIRSEGIVEKAKKYVEANLSKDVSLITVADYVFVSPNYLSFLFKETGENFKEYVLRVRMQKAEEMLGDGNYNYNQIASALGYRDGRYFSQVYKKYKGNSGTI